MKNMSKKIFSILSIVLIVVFTALLLSLFIKGDKGGEPIAFQQINDPRIGGPFETSNNNSRYALVESIVNQGTFLFDDTQAKFAAPDVVAHNGRFFSIFTPGVSFVGIPFYIIGEYLGIPQLLTYSSTHLFALLNIFLVALLTVRLGGRIYHGAISGLVFLFGTNALSFSLTLTQHHLSTFLILLGVLNALGKRTLLTNLVFGAIFGAALLMDIPNALLLLPVGLYIMYKNFSIEHLSEKVKLRLKIGVVGLVVGLIPFLALFGWYNHQTTSSYSTLAQFVGRSDYPVPVEEIEVQNALVAEENPKPKLLSLPFDTRRQINGLYILIISNERGIFYYSPILLIGIMGLLFAYKTKKYKNAALLIFSVVSINIVLYSMFHDPSGGWSFGSRYLIPSGALLSAGLGIGIARFVRNPIFIFVFFILLVYSVGVASLGALTTNAIPPKIEAQNLIDPVPYTYEYNLQFVDKNESSSLLYNLGFYYLINLRNFWYMVSAVAIAFITSFYIYVFFKQNKTKV